SSGQRQALVRNAAVEVVEFAKLVKKPLVVEHLDFTQRKKETTLSVGPRAARMLSSFAYSAMVQAIQSRALKEKVSIKAVNPAYTSVIGRIKYAKRSGVSVHQAAALAIGRRGMGYRESAPVRSEIPDGKGDHFIFELPARNRAKHEWSHWAQVHRKLRGALAEHHRLRNRAAQKVRRAATHEALPV